MYTAWHYPCDAYRVWERKLFNSNIDFRNKKKSMRITLPADGLFFKWRNVTYTVSVHAYFCFSLYLWWSNSHAMKSNWNSMYYPQQFRVFFLLFKFDYFIYEFNIRNIVRSAWYTRVAFQTLKILQPICIYGILCNRPLMYYICV